MEILGFTVWYATNAVQAWGITSWIVDVALFLPYHLFGFAYLIWKLGWIPSELRSAVTLAVTKLGARRVSTVFPNIAAYRP